MRVINPSADLLAARDLDDLGFAAGQIFSTKNWEFFLALDPNRTTLISA